MDDDAPPGGDGRSWKTAYRFLQDGLAVAEAGDEIRVAQGVYQPDRSSDHPEGTGDREVSFTVEVSMTLLGGYAGLGAADPNARDMDFFESKLSGDLRGDDLETDSPSFGEPSRADNSYTVVSSYSWSEVPSVEVSSMDSMTVIDGFIITGGHNRIGSASLDCLSGIWMVRNCKIIANVSEEEGAGIGGRWLIYKELSIHR